MTENTSQQSSITSLTIRERLMRGFLVVFVLLFVSIASNTWILGRLDVANTELRREEDRASYVLRVAAASSDLLTALTTASPSQDTGASIELADSAVASLIEAQSNLRDVFRDLPPSDPYRSEVMQFIARTDRAEDYYDLIVPAIEATNWENVYFYQGQLIEDYFGRGVYRYVDAVIQLTEERQNAAAASVTSAYNLSITIPALLAGLAAVVAAITAFTTIRSITGPAERLVEAATLISAGALDERVEIEREDEFGKIGTALNQMTSRFQNLYTQLEERVGERTRALQEANYALQRRAIQLEASAEVARSIASIFELDQLLRQAVNLIRDEFGFYHAGIFLIDPTGQWAVLEEATGEAGSRMKAEGHRLRVGETSMVGWTALHQQPRITQHAGEDEVRFANPLLPYTRSEMCLPLSFGTQLLGVLNVQSTDEEAFDDDDVRALQSMANQIGVAIRNARQLSEESALLEATSPIYRVGRSLTSATTVDEVVDLIVESVSETGADGCVVVEFEFAPDDTPEALHYLRVWRRDREPLFQPGMRLPIDESPFPFEMVTRMWEIADIETDTSLPDSARQVFHDTGARALVNIPLRAGERMIGQVVVLRTAPGEFSDATMRFYETWSDQVAVALERARLLEKTQRRAEQERIIRDISDKLLLATDMDSLMRTAVEELNRELSSPRGFVRLGTKTELMGGDGDGNGRHDPDHTLAVDSRNGEDEDFTIV